MAVAGPLARSAADLDLELSLLAGPDELLEGKGYTLHLPPPRHDRLGDFRVLVLDTHPLCPTAEGVKAAIETLAGRLGQAGCTVLRRSPAMPTLATTTRVYAELVAAIFDADNNFADHANEAAAAAALAPENQSLRAAELRGATMSHAAWISTSDIRTGLRARWSALFQEIDVLLCPPMPTTAFPQDYAPILTRRLAVDGKSIPYLDQVAWCAVATLNGFPATVMPIGLSGGLPTGVQIVGGYLEDRTTIAFAGLLEREFGGFVAPPALSVVRPPAGRPLSLDRNVSTLQGGAGPTSDPNAAINLLQRNENAGPGQLDTSLGPALDPAIRLPRQHPNLPAILRHQRILADRGYPKIVILLDAQVGRGRLVGHYLEDHQRVPECLQIARDRPSRYRHIRIANPVADHDPHLLDHIKPGWIEPIQHRTRHIENDALVISRSAGHLDDPRPIELMPPLLAIFPGQEAVHGPRLAQDHVHGESLEQIALD